MLYASWLKKWWGTACCLAAVAGSHQASAQASVRGCIAGIKDTTLAFATYKDYISYEERTLTTFNVDSKGSFSTLLPIADTCFVFTTINGVRHYFFGVPDTELNLSLTPTFPLGYPHQHASANQRVDVAGDGGLNTTLQAIDDEASELVELGFRQLKGEDSSTNIIQLLEQAKLRAKPQATPSFIAQYALARAALVEHYVGLEELTHFINANPIGYHNPAYMEAFNECFTLSWHSTLNDSLKLAINRKQSVENVRQLARRWLNTSNEQLAELAALKLLHDSFYKQAFKRTPILAMLDSVALASAYQEHRDIAVGLRLQLQALTVGYAPPPFSLRNTKKQEVSLEQLKGKYVYLSFTSVNSYAAIQDFIHLKKLHDKYSKQVEFISICLDSEHDVQHFTSSEGYTWSFIACGNDADIAHRYNVKIMPCYFLIGKDGKLIQSPAHRPNEGIEAVFKKMLK